MWLSMVTILGICALQLTHPHTAVNTHTWSTIYAAAPGEQLGIRCLAQGHHGHGIEGGESTVHSLPPHLQLMPARDSNLQHLGFKVQLSNH